MTKIELKNLKVEDHPGGVRVIKISRPKALNALNGETIIELHHAVAAAATAPEIRVVVLTGDGEKAFIAGADIVEMKDKSRSEGVEFAKRGQEITRQLQNMPKPVIAAVNGFALGGGTEMAIACDFIFASDNARFGQPEVGLGIIPGFGGTVRLAHFVGMAMAKEMIFSGRSVMADEALRIGLANRVLPQAELLQKTIEFAREISSKSLKAVATAKKLMNEFSEATGLNYKLDSEAQEFGNIFSTADQREGMSAFAEKRKPRFEGVEA